MSAIKSRFSSAFSSVIGTATARNNSSLPTSASATGSSSGSGGSTPSPLALVRGACSVAHRYLLRLLCAFIAVVALLAVWYAFLPDSSHIRHRVRSQLEVMAADLMYEWNKHVSCFDVLTLDCASSPSLYHSYATLNRAVFDSRMSAGHNSDDTRCANRLESAFLFNTHASAWTVLPPSQPPFLPYSFSCDAGSAGATAQQLITFQQTIDVPSIAAATAESASKRLDLVSVQFLYRRRAFLDAAAAAASASHSAPILNSIRFGLSFVADGDSGVLSSAGTLPISSALETGNLADYVSAVGDDPTYDQWIPQHLLARIPTLPALRLALTVQICYRTRAGSGVDTAFATSQFASDVQLQFAHRISSHVTTAIPLSSAEPPRAYIQFRDQPLLYLAPGTSDGTLTLWWSTNCLACTQTVSVSRSLSASANRAVVTSPIHSVALTPTHFAHRVVLTPGNFWRTLVPGTKSPDDAAAASKSTAASSDGTTYVVVRVGSGLYSTAIEFPPRKTVALMFRVDSPTDAPALATDHPSAAHCPLPTESDAPPLDAYQIAIISDSQSAAPVFRHLLSHVVSSAAVPDLLVHGGDMTQNGADIKEWRTYWTAPLEAAFVKQPAAAAAVPAAARTEGGAVSTPDAAPVVSYSIPVLGVRGNHDSEHPNAYAIIPTPSYFANTVGATTTRVRLIVLDSNLDPNLRVKPTKPPAAAAATGTTKPRAASSRLIRFRAKLGDGPETVATAAAEAAAAEADALDPQTVWLESELQSAASRDAMYRIVFVHVPPFVEFWDVNDFWNKGQSGWGSFVRERWVPLFERFNVDLVISGHSHLYQRGRTPPIHVPSTASAATPATASASSPAPQHTIRSASTLTPVEWNRDTPIDAPIIEHRRITRRTPPVDGTAPTATAVTRGGVTYVITGGGGGGLENARVRDYGFYDTTFLDFHYVRVFVVPPQQSGSRENAPSCEAAGHLIGRVYDLNDALVDQFTIGARALAFSRTLW